MRLRISAACTLSIAALPLLFGAPAISGSASVHTPTAVSPERSFTGLQRQVQTGFRFSNHQAKSWMRGAKSRRRLVYISDFLNNTVVVLDSRGSLIGLIGGLTNPSGLYVDAQHNLWVTNTYANQVLVYARGATSPSTTLADPNDLPVDVTVCPNGTVYVANLYGKNNVGSISVYTGGSTKPTGRLAYKGQAWDYFVTCDSAGNVFTTLFAAGSVGAVVEYPGGKQAGARNLGVPLQFPGGIKLDPAGNLLVNDQAARTITEYTESGTPTGKAITYGNSSNDWIDIAVTGGGRIVAGADGYLNQGTALRFSSGRPYRVYQIPYGPSGDEADSIAFDAAQREGTR